MSTDQTRSAADVDTVLDLVADPVVVWDCDLRIDHWNRAAGVLYGFAREEALGRGLVELLCTDFPTPLAEIMEALADSGRWEGNLVRRAKDGRELIVESRLVARFDDAGRLSGGVSVDRDITARPPAGEPVPGPAGDAEAERRRSRVHNAQRLANVGQLAGGIAHDFNNILAIIINYAALIAGDIDAVSRTSGDERLDSMRSDLREIEMAAGRAARLTHQLLAFAHEGVGTPVAVDLNESVRGVEQLLRRTLGEQIELVIELGDELHQILADPSQLDHALVHLAINGRDAMAEGGTLRIDTANVDLDADFTRSRADLLPGPHVRLRVSDTGTGMAPGVLDRAFDPFFTTKPLGEGTGLGLATVYGTVRQARGRAQLRSRPGVGTTFTALFPAVGESPVGGMLAALLPPVVAPTLEPSTRTILLVEDEAPLRQVTERILEGAGYTVVAAAGGEEALAVLAAPVTIDLLLTDVVMPGMLGHQLVAKLHERHPELRVLYMSGFAGPIVERTINMGEGDLLEKPFTAAGLLARVAAALERG